MCECGDRFPLNMLIEGVVGDSFSRCTQASEVQCLLRPVFTFIDMTSLLSPIYKPKLTVTDSKELIRAHTDRCVLAWNFDCRVSLKILNCANRKTSFSSETIPCIAVN
ncbi:hypothetical protein GDO81_013405 [Engystomops pustulosus]|uniref:Uncharacterized protein n=1 Tax=Engystomops pustulosus TaxID=76066 RepID=A0AAV7AZ83_ENGPU|nr:hypothetical protein GDO81_013405 [Engystomops pustulosus]